MGPAKNNSETKKLLKNSGRRHTSAFEALFKKAHELAVLCEAEVAIIILSGEGLINQFATSSMQDIITRFRRCRSALNSNPNEAKEAVRKEVDVVRQRAEEHKLERNFVGVDFGRMNLQELFVLEEKLNKGLLCIKDRKMQLLEEELEQSRMLQEQQMMFQINQILLRQVEGFIPPIYNPMPLPQMEGDTRPAYREFLPLTTFAGEHTGLH